MTTANTPFFFGFLTAADATQAAMTWACRYGIPNTIQATETIYTKLTCEQAQRTYAAITIRIGELTLTMVQFIYAIALFIYALVKTWADNTVAECITESEAPGWESSVPDLVPGTLSDDQELVLDIHDIVAEDETIPVEVDDTKAVLIEELTWNTLRQFAAEHGVKGRKKTELLQGLHDVGITHYIG